MTDHKSESIVLDEDEYIGGLHKRIQQGDTVPQEDLQKAVMFSIQKLFDAELSKKISVMQKVTIEGTPKVEVDFPQVQKVEGKTEIENFPDFKKLFFDALAAIKFPALQKITGKVDANVQFPELQKVEGKITNFPDVQKVVGEVVAKLDLEKLADTMQEAFVKATRNERPDKYINVRLTNGRQFYDAVSMAVSKAGANSRQSALGVPPHDYISVLYPDATTEQYTYKVGGSSGSVVAIVTVGYTSAAKTTISYVQRV